MMMAALQGGLTFQKGLGGVHALSHPLGALATRPHHGTLNAIFLPHVLRFNADACPQKIRAMANRLGLAESGDLPDTFARLCEDLKLPAHLGALGITASDVEPLGRKALADHCSLSNPRPMSLKDCHQLYRAAL